MPIWSVYCATPVPKRGGGRGCTVFFVFVLRLHRQRVAYSFGRWTKWNKSIRRTINAYTRLYNPFLSHLSDLFALCSFFLFQLVLFWRVVGYSAGGLIPIRQSAPAKRRVKEKRRFEDDGGGMEQQQRLIQSLSICLYLHSVNTNS